MPFLKKQKFRSSLPVHIEQAEILEEFDSQGRRILVSKVVADNTEDSIKTSPVYGDVTLKDLLESGVQVKSVNPTVISPSRVDTLQTIGESVAAEYLNKAAESELLEKNVE